MMTVWQVTFPSGEVCSELYLQYAEVAAFVGTDLLPRCTISQRETDVVFCVFSEAECDYDNPCPSLEGVYSTHEAAKLACLDKSYSVEIYELRQGHADAYSPAIEPRDRVTDLSGFVADVTPPAIDPSTGLTGRPVSLTVNFPGIDVMELARKAGLIVDESTHTVTADMMNDEVRDMLRTLKQRP